MCMPRRMRSMYGQLQSFKFSEGPKPASATSFSQYSRGKYLSGWEVEGEKSGQLQGPAVLLPGLLDGIYGPGTRL